MSVGIDLSCRAMLLTLPHVPSSTQRVTGACPHVGQLHPSCARSCSRLALHKLCRGDEADRLRRDPFSQLGHGPSACVTPGEASPSTCILCADGAHWVVDQVSACGGECTWGCRALVSIAGPSGRARLRTEGAAAMATPRARALSVAVFAV